MQVDHRYQKSEEHEGVDQGRANHDLCPVVAAHVGADCHQAKHEEEPGGNVAGPLPENACAYPENQQFLQEPDARQDVRSGRRIPDHGLRRMNLLRPRVFPGHLDGAANLVAQPTQGLDVVGIGPLSQDDRSDREQRVANVRPIDRLRSRRGGGLLSPTLDVRGGGPEKICRDLFLNVGSEQTAHAYRAHPCDLHQHHDGVKKYHPGAGQTERSQPGPAPGRAEGGMQRLSPSPFDPQRCGNKSWMCRHDRLSRAYIF